MKTAAAVHRHLLTLANPDQAKVSQWFFKTGPGEYGEGDQFLGIRVPVLRTQVRVLGELPAAEVRTLLRSPWHEERLLAALVLVRQFTRGDAATRAAVYRLYLDNLDRINNWDIVDGSAPQIVGGYLDGRGLPTLLKLAASPNLWSRRVAMLATLHTIRRGEFDDTLALATRLLRDPEDLMHKAVGWMLREMGKRDLATLCQFLDAHAATMPRTMLRYALEKVPAARRVAYMKAGKVPRRVV